MANCRGACLSFISMTADGVERRPGPWTPSPRPSPAELPLSACSSHLILTNDIANAARRANQLALVRMVNIVPQSADVNIHDVRRSVEALVPHMLNYHRT
jgi:hypothetical protein